MCIVSLRLAFISFLFVCSLRVPFLDNPFQIILSPLRELWAGKVVFLRNPDDWKDERRMRRYSASQFFCILWIEANGIYIPFVWLWLFFLSHCLNNRREQSLVVAGEMVFTISRKEWKKQGKKVKSEHIYSSKLVRNTFFSQKYKIFVRYSYEYLTGLFACVRALLISHCILCRMFWFSYENSFSISGTSILLVPSAKSTPWLVITGKVFEGQIRSEYTSFLIIIEILKTWTREPYSNMYVITFTYWLHFILGLRFLSIFGVSQRIPIWICDSKVWISILY